MLATDGVAILQVPIALKLEAMIELGSASTPAERIAQAGQDDHLRLFTQADYRAALEAAGFAVELFDPFAEDGQAATDWQLDRSRKLWLCRKAKARRRAAASTTVYLRRTAPFRRCRPAPPAEQVEGHYRHRRIGQQFPGRRKIARHRIGEQACLVAASCSSPNRPPAGQSRHAGDWRD